MAHAFTRFSENFLKLAVGQAQERARREENARLKRQEQEFRIKAAELEQKQREKSASLKAKLSLGELLIKQGAFEEGTALFREAGLVTKENEGRFKSTLQTIQEKQQREARVKRQTDFLKTMKGLDARARTQAGPLAGTGRLFRGPEGTQGQGLQSIVERLERRKRDALAGKFERPAVVGAESSLVDVRTGKPLFTGKGKKETGKVVNILLPNGSPATGVERGEQLLMRQADGSLAPAPPGTQKLTLRSEAKDQPSRVLLRQRTESRIQLRNLISVRNSVVNLIGKKGVVLGGTGTILTKLSGLVQQSKQLAKAFSVTPAGEVGHFDKKTGESLTVKEILDPRRYDFSGLRGVAGATVRAKAGLIALAYTIARSREDSARLSDKDVQNALETLGLKSSDPKLIAAAIQDRVEEAAEGIMNLEEEFTGKRPSREAFDKEFRVGFRKSRPATPASRSGGGRSRIRFDAQGRRIQ